MSEFCCGAKVPGTMTDRDGFQSLGYDLAATVDGIDFNDSERAAFVRLDKALYDRLQAGGLRC